jgi:monoamine oxidase
MVEGYDAADPARASTLALRDEWMGGDGGERDQARLEEGYGALLRFLESECRKHGATIRLNAEVKGIEVGRGKTIVGCADGRHDEADAVIVTVPPPILRGIAFVPALPAKMAAVTNIGYGNVIKILLRFERRWWADFHGADLARMSFLFSDEIVPTWWTQYPRPHPVLTGWLAGPRTEKMMHLSSEEIVDTGLASLARAFDVSTDDLGKQLIASRAIDWRKDPFARGAYSYATPETKAARAELLEPVDGIVFFSGEALYQGKEMGTVEAALASGRETATRILRGRAESPGRGRST